MRVCVGVSFWDAQILAVYALASLSRVARALFLCHFRPLWLTLIFRVAICLSPRNDDGLRLCSGFRIQGSNLECQGLWTVGCIHSSEAW